MTNLTDLIKKIFKPVLEIPPDVYNGHGFIEVNPRPEDYVLGSSVQAAKQILSRTHDHSGFLPTREYQSRDWDTFSCVIYSMLNNIEIIFKEQYGINYNFAERYLASLTPVRWGTGTSFSAACDALRAYGLVFEEEYPWVNETRSTYYDRPSESIIEKGKAFLQSYDIQHEWVDFGGCDPEKLYEALTFGPIQASVNSAATYTGKRVVAATDHAITIVKAVYKKSFTILDHYSRETYEVPWNFYFGSAKQFTILKKKEIPVVQIYNAPTAEERAKLYAIYGTVASHISDFDTWEFGGQLGIWSGPGGSVTSLPLATFNNRFTIGKSIKFV